MKTIYLFIYYKYTNTSNNSNVFLSVIIVKWFIYVLTHKI